MLNPFRPKPAPPAFGSGRVLPEHDANYLSRLVFHWLSPFLQVGYSRPLEKEDLWELPEEKHTVTLTGNLERNFFNRCPPEKRPHFMRDTTLNGKHEKMAEEKKYDSSVVKALHQTFALPWWTSGVLKLIADTLRTTTPLLNRVLLDWLSESYVYHRLPEEQREGISRPRGIGYGIGLSFALFVMQEAASLLTNHSMNIGMTTGLAMRASIIGNIFRKSVRLSGRARLQHSVGQITTMISNDASRFDLFSSNAHTLWIAPIQLIIGVGLLIGNLGYSALVGLGVLILGFPLQIFLVRIMFRQRRKGMKFTDARMRLTTEVLQGIRLLKFYSWEDFYAGQIGKARKREVRTIQKYVSARAVMIGIITFIPILCAILSFITYALTGHDLNVAIIFSSLQLFNIIRMPLVFLPFVLTMLSDVLVALRRVSTFLQAEELDEPYMIDYDSKLAVQVEDGDFTWETAGKLEEPKFRGSKSGKRDSTKPKGKQQVLPTARPVSETQPSEDASGDSSSEEKPFELKSLNLKIERGAFIGIVGAIGSGKSSILQALIGEMRRIKGQVTFGGTVAYVPQTAWIKNTTLRENIVFGQEDNEKRFREVIRACSLEHDLEILPDGENTEIGERGINLSGGQKARVSLARAVYSNADIVLLDDPLSAVDAYVGKEILEECLLHGLLADKTRILVTHALHVVDKLDYIYFLENGVIAGEGNYTDLKRTNASFSRLMDDYGSMEPEKEKSGEDNNDDANERSNEGKAEDQEKHAKDLMQKEEREIGSVSWSVYKRYLRFAGGLILLPLFVGLLVATQGAQVSNNLFLGFWTSQSISGFQQGDYMAVYAGLGAAQAVFQFLVTLAFSLASLHASYNTFLTSLRHIMRSPVAFFDTTPLGRIVSRLSKDLDVLDNQLAMTLMQFLTTFSSVLGTIALVFYIFPYLGILFAPLMVLYQLVSTYYRHSSVEVRRLDSLMRSALYASYSETMTGLSTIRAYKAQDRALQTAEHGLDLQNKAYYLSISMQRWLSVRLDLFGNILLLGIGLFGAGFRTSVNPSRIGVVLTYTLSITQMFSEMVAQFAQNEQNMNAAERLLFYTELPPEGDTVTKDDPPPTWPERGSIRFVDVSMRYREKLPLVLKGVSFEVKPGEKIGIVGRTGAGKSSLLQALFRIAELDGGRIEIDDVDVRHIGLSTLRGRLALVPQDSTLFLGTLRDNLDPLGSRTHAELIQALQRSWLLPRDGTEDPAAEAKFSLDSTVGDEGSNFSAGEKQLLALCRALVKNSRIIVLDEATSNVDVETDAKLQRTIQIEFASSTLICIAHRLNTIAYYDKVLVMSEGRVAEFDTVLDLFDKEDSIFRSLCNEANLTRADIERIRKEHTNRQNAEK